MSNTTTIDAYIYDSSVDRDPNAYPVLVREAEYGLPNGEGIAVEKNEEIGTLRLKNVPAEIAAHIAHKLTSRRSLNGQQIWSVLIQPGPRPAPQRFSTDNRHNVPPPELSELPDEYHDLLTKLASHRSFTAFL